jgi:hypothetical protein
MGRFIIAIAILLFLGCGQNNTDNRNRTSSTEQEQPQTSYEFKYNKLTASFQIKDLSGRIVFTKNEVLVYQGSQGEKFYIKDISLEDSKLILNTVNNKNEKAVFKLYQVQNKSNIEADLDGVLMVFAIISGNISELKVYNQSKPSNEVISLNNSVDYCDCQNIHRDDGTEITQCISLPVASDSELEFGLAIASNGQNNFITTTIRFFGNVKEVNGNLSIRLKDNNLISFELVNKGLAYIGNNQVSQAIFALDENKIKKLKTSDLQTVSLQLDRLIYTLECSENTAILSEQLSCLTKNKNVKKFHSQKYNYNIIVPEGFNETQATGKRIDLKLVSQDATSILVNVSERLPEEYNISAHDYTKEFLENSYRQYTPDIRVTKAEKTYIDNNKAFLIHYINPSKSLKALEIYFYKGDKAYVLTATTKISQFADYENIFMETYKSLKFK